MIYGPNNPDNRKKKPKKMIYKCKQLRQDTTNVP